MHHPNQPEICRIQKVETKSKLCKRLYGLALQRSRTGRVTLLPSSLKSLNLGTRNQKPITNNSVLCHPPSVLRLLSSVLCLLLPSSDYQIQRAFRQRFAAGFRHHYRVSETHGVVGITVH